MADQVHLLGKDAKAMIAAGHLPPELEQNSLLVQFREPIASREVSIFYSIKLTEYALKAGEPSVYQAELWQPNAIKVKQCAECGNFLIQKKEALHRCETRSCKMYLRPIAGGAVSGVVAAVTFKDFITHVTRVDFDQGEPVFIEWIDAVLLVLDRRYPDGVRAGVRNVVGQLCEMKGWKLK